MTAAKAQAVFEQRRRQAHAALRAGRAATAERWLRALEAQQPGEVNCLWLLGAALLDQGKVAESCGLLERVVAAAADFSACTGRSRPRLSARRAMPDRHARRCAGC